MSPQMNLVLFWEFNIPGLTGEFRIAAEKTDNYEKDSINDTIKDTKLFWMSNFENSVATLKLKNTNVPNLKWFLNRSPKRN
jgi:hypothetical protein